MEWNVNNDDVNHIVYHMIDNSLHTYGCTTHMMCTMMVYTAPEKPCPHTTPPTHPPTHNHQHTYRHNKRIIQQPTNHIKACIM